jgi:uncharacterized cupredoxin-like copper-binding protein
MSQRVKSLVATSFAIALATAAVAHESSQREASLDTAFGRPGQLANVTRTVKVEGYEFEFAPADLTFKVGETVRFEFVNTGNEPHEMTIGDAAYQAEHRAMMSKMAKEAKARGEKVQHAHAGADMHGAQGNVAEANPGEKREIIWQFTKPGTFEIGCNIPGHSELGMTGTIKVD